MDCRNLRWLVIAACVAVLLLGAHGVDAASSKGKGKQNKGKNGGGGGGNNNRHKRKKGLCQSTLGHSFLAQPPMERTDLTFCQQFKKKTCCTKEHTQDALRRAYPYLTEDSMSAECRNWGTKLACAGCDPGVGTGTTKGVCHRVCDSWFYACRSDLFTADKLDGHIIPCSFDSLVCSPLSAIVSSGKQLCERAGFHVVPRPSAARRGNFNSDSTSVVDLLKEVTAEERMKAAATCFDGNAPPLMSYDERMRRQRQRDASSFATAFNKQTKKIKKKTTRFIADYGLYILVIAVALLVALRYVFAQRRAGKGPVSAQIIRDLRAKHFDADMAAMAASAAPSSPPILN